MKKIFFIVFFLAFSPLISAEVIFPKTGERGDAYYAQDVEKSLKMAEDGCVRFQYLVGVAYLYGFDEQDVTQNTETGLYWLNKAVEQDAAEAYYEIGKAYRYGVGVDIDGDKWEKYVTEAAEQGLPSAYGELMDVYRDGDKALGIEKNDKKYFQWLKVSAESGHAPSMMNMAISYRYGYDVEVDIDKSFEWLMRAVDEDNLSAQGMAGEYFEKGLGTEKDLVKAYMMYDLGGTGSNPEKQAVAKKMTEEQIQEAISLSRKWQEEHNNMRPSYYGLQYQEDGSYR